MKDNFQNEKLINIKLNVPHSWFSEAVLHVDVVGARINRCKKIMKRKILHHSSLALYGMESVLHSLQYVWF